MSKHILRRGFIAASAALAAPRVASPAAKVEARSGIFNVVKHGAVGDGAHLNTKAIHSAIDACAKGGGGAVYFPPGRYLTGTIFLKNNVTLHLEAGAVVLGSKNLKDYPATRPAFRSYTDNYTERSLIYGEKLENISIMGRGAIDGQGASFEGPYKVRPYMFRLIECRNVVVEGVLLKDSPMWGLHLLACEDVNVHGVSIHSRVNRNNDGIDIDCCARVRVSDCEISSGDDAIVFKSTAARATTDVTVTNCVLSSHCNALKMGTESNGGFQNIAISNCSIYDTRLSGIALEVVDGGVMDHVSVSNITISKIGAPIFIRLGDRARPFTEGGMRPPAGKLRNVFISNVQAAGAGRIGCAISGIPGHSIENLSLDNIRLAFEGGGSREDARRPIPEEAGKYPEHSMFGVLAAYGFYCRHVKNLNLRNVELSFEAAEGRPALVCDDVEGLDLAGARFSCLAQGEPPVTLHQVRDAFIHGNRASRSANTYIQIGGDRSDDIRISGNDLAKGQKAFEASSEVPGAAVTLGGGQG